MIAYRQVWNPHLGQVVTPVVSTPVVSTPAVSGAPVPEGLFWTTVAGAAAWAAIRTGMKEKGLVSLAGWVGGVGAGLAALTGLTGLVAPSAARTLPVRWYWV